MRLQTPNSIKSIIPANIKYFFPLSGSDFDKISPTIVQPIGVKNRSINKPMIGPGIKISLMLNQTTLINTHD